jgi:nucleoside-diphosphate-sugar epimerase
MRTISSDVLHGVEAVINLGGLSNDPTAEYNPAANYEMNTVACVRLAEMCVAQGVHRFIFASSCSIYDLGVDSEEHDVVYSASKRAAEKALLEMVSDSFCPVILRKGTVCGFSPRMRYDLVVNTFVKDALQNGYITVYSGGEMWRPIVDIHDVARAYVVCLRADDAKVRGEIFNLSYRNFRISELALRVRRTLQEMGIECDIRADYRYRGVRSYRVSTQKLERVLGVSPTISVEETVKDMCDKIYAYGCTDFDDPRYYNIRWMRTLEEAHKVISVTGSVFRVTGE